MIAFIRLAVLAFLGLSVLYLLVATYSRSVRRESLEKEWDANPPEGKGDAERSVFIKDGMDRYEHGLKKRLLWLVFIIPMVLMAVIVYMIDFQ